MATSTQKLTHAQFQQQYEHGDRAFEFWYGEPIPKGTPTWVHGLLQSIICRLLLEAGFRAAVEVELRIDPQAHPKPDLIATKTKLPHGPYPTEAMEVVVEILSEDDSFLMLKQKCRKYHEWGFSQICLVDPSDRSVSRWIDGSFHPADDLAGVPVNRIWNQPNQAAPPSEVQMEKNLQNA